MNPKRIYLYLAVVVAVLAFAAFGCSAAEQAPVADAPLPVAGLEEPTAEPALVVAEAPSEEVEGVEPEAAEPFDSAQGEPTEPFDSAQDKPAKLEMVRKPIAWPVFKFDTGVPAADREFVRTVVKTVQQYFVIPRPKGPPVKVTVVGYWNRCPLGDILAMGYSGGLEVCLSLSGWRGDTVMNWHLLAHEWFHVIQERFAVRDDYLAAEISDSPAWLAEGSAEWMAWNAVTHFGVASQAYAEGMMRDWASSVSAPLKRMITPKQLWGASPGTSASYGVAYWAVDYLGATSQKLLLFYRRIGEGMEFQQAAKRTFGRAINSKFYKDFEAYRVRGFYN